MRVSPLCTRSSSDGLPLWQALAVMVAALMLVVAVRATGPSDLNELDQPLQAAYVADILANGHYFLQWDHQGRVATKPPLYNWLAAALISLWGAPSEFMLKLPSVLAAFGTMLLTFLLARRWLEPWTALAAVLMLASGHHFFKIAFLARTDMLLCFWIVSSLYAFERAWAGGGRSGKWNLLFWLCQAMAMLTKGPAGPALVHVYVLSRLAVARDLRGYFTLRPVWGIPLLVGISLIWLLPALSQGGESFVDRVLKGEILFRLQGTGPRARELQPVYAFFPWFIGRFLPWSLLTVAALLGTGRDSVLRKDSPLLPAALWLGAMMAFLSLIPSKRPDWLMPVYPAGAILAAYVFQGMASEHENPGSRVERSVRFLCMLIAVLLAGMGLLILFPMAIPPSLRAMAVPQAVLRGSVPFILQVMVGVLFIAGGGLALIGMRRFKPKVALGGFLVGLVALNLFYYHAVTPPAVTRDGEKLRQFMARAREAIPSGETIIFGLTRTPAQFFLLQNKEPADAETIIHRVSMGQPFWVLMRLNELQKLEKARDIAFEILFVSEYLEYDESSLVLARWLGGGR